MAMFDWLVNPVWAAMAKTPPLRQYRLSQLLVACVLGEEVVRNACVVPFINLCTAKGGEMANVLAVGGHATPLVMSDDQEKQMAFEAFLALLRSGHRQDSVAEYLPGLDADTFAWCVAFIALARQAKHTSGGMPSTPDDLPYSTSPAEARTQLISAWMEILHVRNRWFVNLLNDAGLLSPWDNMVDSFLGGAALAISRMKQKGDLQWQAKIVARSIPVECTDAMKLLIQVPFETARARDAVEALRGLIRANMPAIAKERVQKASPEEPESQFMQLGEPVPGFSEGSVIGVDVDAAMRKVRIVGDRRTVDVPMAVLMALWLVAEKEGWAGPTLWLQGPDGMRTFAGFGKVHAISARDAKAFGEAIEKKSVRSDATAVEGEELLGIRELLCICREGGFRIV